MEFFVSISQEHMDKIRKLMSDHDILYVNDIYSTPGTITLKFTSKENKDKAVELLDGAGVPFEIEAKKNMNGN
jgi:hypothetical protein